MSLPIRIAQIVRQAADAHGVTPEEILSPRKFRPIARARDEAIMRCRELTPQPSYPMIGRWFGGRCHGTIIVAERRAAMRSGRDRPPRLIVWTKEWDARLHEEFERGKSAGEIARSVGRSSNAVAARARTLGIRFRWAEMRRQA
jgi:hypothetical protein